jgi:hypothetical protein
MKVIAPSTDGHFTGPAVQLGMLAGDETGQV